jgi:tRNA(Arg) A34 adenosine deaminase TadA
VDDTQAARWLRRAHAVARAAMDAGHHPFGALLVGPDGETVLLEQGNVDNAESVLAREAARRFDAATPRTRRWTRPAARSSRASRRRCRSSAQ